MKNIFTRHPNNIGESYITHFLKACAFGFKLLFIAFRVFIHAIFPFLFEYSASNKISQLNKDLQQRKNNIKDSSEN